MERPDATTYQPDSPDTLALRELAREALLIAFDEGPSGVRTSALRPLITRMCESAHQKGLRAEQLIVIVKEAWRLIPKPRDAVSGTHDPALQRVIALSIEEYYDHVRRAPSSFSSAPELRAPS